MAKYLIIESRDPFDSNDVASCYEMATGLAKEGNTVTLFLVQNGVFPARRGPRSAALSALAKSSIEILADDFSLRERGITPDRLAAGVKAAPLDIVIDHLAAGSRALWH